MLICADSAIACSGCSLGHAQRELQRRRRGVRDGLGAEHLEDGVRHAHRSAGEVPRDRLLGRPPAGDALPARLHHADELVGAVDRHDRVLRRVGHAVDDERLGVGLEGLQHRVLGAQPLPRLEVELALGRAGRARVEPDHAARDGRDHEEREPDRDLERRPLLVGEHEVVEPHRAVADGAELGVARAHRPAGLAHAQDPPLVEVQQVAVLGRERERAQLALLVRVRRRRRRGGGGSAGRSRRRLLDEARPDLLHATATRTLSPSRSSGTGLSCSPSSLGAARRAAGRTSARRSGRSACRR